MNRAEFQPRKHRLRRIVAAAALTFGAPAVAAEAAFPQSTTPQTETSSTTTNPGVTDTGLVRVIVPCGPDLLGRPVPPERICDTDIPAEVAIAEGAQLSPNTTSPIPTDTHIPGRVSVRVKCPPTDVEGRPVPTNVVCFYPTEPKSAVPAAPIATHPAIEPAPDQPKRTINPWVAVPLAGLSLSLFGVGTGILLIERKRTRVKKP